MRVSGIGASRPVSGGPSSRGDVVAAAETGTALVAVTPAAAASHHLHNNRPALFLAQLIAEREQVPQMRERRRAEPGDATHAYTATLNGQPFVAPHFSRNF